MKRILVCVKLVPEAQEVELDGQFRLKRDSTKLKLNIADISAVEAALQMKAAQPEREVTVLSMGPEKSASVLQELYALGVDRVVLLSDRVLVGSDSLATARALAAAIRCLGEFDCVFCGRRAIDAETGQIPGQLAAALGICVVTNVQKVDAEQEMLCHRRLENGIAIVQPSMPCVISFCEYVYPLRLPSIMGRRRAKNMQAMILSAADVGISRDDCGLSGSRTQVVHVDTKAPGRRSCKFLEAKDIVATIREVCL